MSDDLINLVFGLIIVLGVVVVVVFKTARVASQLREQADRIEAAARRLEKTMADQAVVNACFDRRLDCATKGGSDG